MPTRPTRRTQPFRAAGGRQESSALAAAQRGRPALLQTLTPADVRRQAMKKRRRRRKPRSRYRSPMQKVLAQRRAAAAPARRGGR